MYVCLCNGITERTVRQAAANGVCSLAELTRRTGCAGSCGNCAEYAEQLLHEERDRSHLLMAVSAAA
jgi:bacterioferritin-associated ferredoxin